MDRREFVSLASILLSTSTPWKLFAQQHAVDGGWLDFPNRPTPNVASRRALQLSGSGEGKIVLLWRALEMGSKMVIAPYRQEGGDCVGVSTALGVDVLAGIQAMYGQASWRGRHTSETIYAGSRVQIAIEKHGYRRVSRLGGSMVSWASEWLKDYGALLREKYEEYDLRTYNYSLARAWANAGVPDELQELCKKHPVVTATKVDGGWTQACDLIANGFPIVIGSRGGFNNTFDEDGFLKQNRVWKHAMLLWGVDNQSRRPGGCFANSFGDDWTSNKVQHKYGTPPGSFWADAKDVDRMLNHGDAYALSNFRGYPRRKLDYLFG